jgi:hypothetical protein
MKTLFIALAVSATAAAAEPAAAPGGPWDPEVRMAAQREAMKALAFLDGEWRGTASSDEIAGEMRHTERVGTLLDGTIRLIEGRAYDSSGQTRFNAFAIISYDPVKRAYSLRTHSTGFAGDHPLTVRADGFSWSHSAGPGATVRYTATVKNGEWHEVGERVVGNVPPVKTVELRVRRTGASKWPRAGAVAPK